MAVNAEMMAALSAAVGALDNDAPRPIPASTVAALAGIARPGTRLRIDTTASAAIGAPLIMVEQLPHDIALFAPLTARQRQVASLITQGQANKEIAHALGITLATVKDHVHAILQKLNLPSRAAVMAAASGAGS